MPLFEALVTKAWGGRNLRNTWSTRYPIEGEWNVALGEGGSVLDQLVAAEKDWHLPEVKFIRARLRPMVRTNNQLFISKAYTGTGMRVTDSPALPLEVSLLLSFNTVYGRRGVRPYRGVLTEEDVTNGPDGWALKAGSPLLTPADPTHVPSTKLNTMISTVHFALPPKKSSDPVRRVSTVTTAGVQHYQRYKQRTSSERAAIEAAQRVLDDYQRKYERVWAYVEDVVPSAAQWIIINGLKLAAKTYLKGLPAAVASAVILPALTAGDDE